MKGIAFHLFRVSSVKEIVFSVSSDLLGGYWKKVNSLSEMWWNMPPGTGHMLGFPVQIWIHVLIQGLFSDGKMMYLFQSYHKEGISVCWFWQPS